ncbi:MAG: hypothetical protein EOO19_03370 [Chryseobacterium sp.]|nr:MAG: hypothetical protein EOO19_03370 [Chryseobacterium sp.]
MMKRDKFIFLFSKKLLGEIETADRVLLDKSISENEEYQKLADQLTRYFNQKPAAADGDSLQQLHLTWNHIEDIKNENFEGKYTFSTSKSQRYPAIWIRVAAILIVLSTISFSVYTLFNQTSTEIVQLSTVNEKTFKITYYSCGCFCRSFVFLLGRR